MRGTALLVLLLVTPVWGQTLVGEIAWEYAATEALGFAIERQDGGLGEFVEIGTATAEARVYRDYGTVAGQGYCYRLRAVTAAGPSGYSNILCQTCAAPDTIPPTAHIVSPLPGAVPRKAWVTIQVAAHDETGLSHVEVSLNGSLLCLTMVSPFQCAFRTAAKPGKTYRIEARAYDLAGNRGDAQSVTVIVH